MDQKEDGPEGPLRSQPESATVKMKKQCPVEGHRHHTATEEGKGGRTWHSNNFGQSGHCEIHCPMHISKELRKTTFEFHCDSADFIVTCKRNES